MLALGHPYRQYGCFFMLALGHLYRKHGFWCMKIIYRVYRSISGYVLDYWGPKAPGSRYYALLRSQFPYKSCLRVRSSMKAEPISVLPPKSTLPTPVVRIFLNIVIPHLYLIAGTGIAV